MADLERVLQQIQESEINAGVQTSHDAGMRAWIGDETEGILYCIGLLQGCSSEDWSSIAVVTATKMPTQKRHTPFGCGGACGDRSVSFRAPEVILHSCDRYLIEIKDIETGEALMCEAVDWTDEQRRFFIAQVLRLAGIPAAGDEPEQGSGPLQ